MHTYNELEITEIWPSEFGYYLVAKYSDWCSGYRFFIQRDGRVMGESGSGSWLELSSDLGYCIDAKFKSAVFDAGRLRS